MIIGIDIDDTLTQFHDYKIKMALDYIISNNLPFKIVCPDAAYMKDIIDWGKDDCNKFWIDQGDSLFNNTPLRENVAEIITNLKNKGHKIIIITARTTDLHKDPYKLSYDWLKRNNIPFDKLIVGQLDKTKACLDEKVDVFVDDRPENLIKLQKYGIRTFLMETEPNKKQTIYNGEKVSNWNEIENLLK